MAEWVEIRSDRHAGLSFFWHVTTGETQWERPDGVEIAPPPPHPAGAPPAAARPQVLHRKPVLQPPGRGQLQVPTLPGKRSAEGHWLQPTTEPAMKRFASAETRLPAGEQGKLLSGRVKTWNPHKGYGFIECAETHAEYGRDVHFGDRVLAAAGHSGVSPGQHIAFTATGNHDKDSGKGVHATEVIVVPCEGEWLRGSIKHWNAGKGIGFIDCPELHAVHGRDCFLGDQTLASSGVVAGEHLAGAPVAFVAEVTGRGTPQAAAIVMCPAELQQPQSIPLLTINPNPAPDGRGHGQRPPCKFFPKGTCNKGDQCTFSHDEGAGGESGGHWLSPSPVSPVGYPAADPVSVAVPHAQPVAAPAAAAVPCRFWAAGKCDKGYNCRFAHDESAAPAAEGEERWVRGVIKNWNHAKGFGFIANHEVHSQFDRDCHIGDKVLTAGDIHIGPDLNGTPILFTYKATTRGTPQATQATLASSPPAMCS